VQFYHFVQKNQSQAERDCNRKIWVFGFYQDFFKKKEKEVD